MSRKHRIEITVETEQLVVIRRHATLHCAQCASQGAMLTAEEAAAVAGISLSSLHHDIRESGFHTAETAEGQLLVCLNSLLDVTTKGESL